MTWDELVADVIARHPLHESKMFGMPWLKRENGKVVDDWLSARRQLWEARLNRFDHYVKQLKERESKS